MHLRTRARASTPCKVFVRCLFTANVRATKKKKRPNFTIKRCFGPVLAAAASDTISDSDRLMISNNESVTPRIQVPWPPELLQPIGLFVAFGLFGSRLAPELDWKCASWANRLQVIDGVYLTTCICWQWELCMYKCLVYTCIYCLFASITTRNRPIANLQIPKNIKTVSYFL